MVRIENWGVVGSADPYLAPELQKLKLHGAVYGHPTQEEGKIVSTSRILDADGLVVTCESRKYLLGQVSPDYLKALDEIGYKFDPENPIKVHKRGVCVVCGWPEETARERESGSIVCDYCYAMKERDLNDRADLGIRVPAVRAGLRDCEDKEKVMSEEKRALTWEDVAEEYTKAFGGRPKTAERDRADVQYMEMEEVWDRVAALGHIEIDPSGSMHFKEVDKPKSIDLAPSWETAVTIHAQAWAEGSRYSLGCLQAIGRGIDHFAKLCKERRSYGEVTLDAEDVKRICEIMNGVK